MLQMKAARPTVRDGGNLSVVLFSQIIFMWIVCDLFGWPVPREVAGAFGGLCGYVAARFLRY